MSKLRWGSSTAAQSLPHRPEHIDVELPQLRQCPEHDEINDRMQDVDPLDPLHVREEPLTLAPLARGDLDDRRERRAVRKHTSGAIVHVGPALVRVVREVVLPGEDAFRDAGDEEREVDDGVEEGYDQEAFEGAWAEHGVVVRA